MQTQSVLSKNVQDFLSQIEQTLLFKDAQTKGSLQYQVEFYRRTYPRKRRSFQIAGSMVIFLSATLPIIAAFGGRIIPASNSDLKDFVVASIAALIAVLSGFNSFFRWDAGWRGQTTAMLSLQSLMAQWEVKKAEALIEPDPAKGLEILEQAVEKIITDANSIVTSETQEFFTMQKFPDSKSGK